MAKTNPKRITIVPNVTATTAHDMGKQQSQNVSAYTTNRHGENNSPFYTIEVTRKTYTELLGKKLQSPILCVSKNSTKLTSHPVRKGYSHIIRKSMREKCVGKN